MYSRVERIWGRARVSVLVCIRGAAFEMVYGGFGVFWGWCWESVIVLCSVVRYFMSILVLQSS